MENYRAPDFMQNGTATSPGLLSRSLQIADRIGSEIPVPDLIPTSCVKDWQIHEPSPPLPNREYLEMPPLPYGASTSQLYTSQSSQPTVHNSMHIMYNSGSSFPYSCKWSDERYGTYTVASQVPEQSTVATTFPNLPAYPYSYVETGYSHSSLIDDSPISSPESIDSYTDGHYNLGSQSSLAQPTYPLVERMNGITSSESMVMMNNFEMQGSYPMMSCSETHAMQFNTKPSKKAIRMPQRKGGIQLWQFLYGLLMDSKHSNLIEWTSNRVLNEFRLLEPESIAVWWGTLKSKPTMTYDKFSRSLRYYYHKGILKKIPGERYVYRFLVDPEDMYKHIGTSDKRPAIKAMPKEAKMVMNMFQKKPTFTNDHESTKIPIVTKPPVGLQESLHTSTSGDELSPDSSSLNSFALHSFATADFNNSNNTCTSTNNSSLVFSLAKSQPISIQAI